MRTTLLVIAASLSLSFVHGCATLTRFDPRDLSCCADTRNYYRMAQGDYGLVVAAPARYRPLVPAVARAFLALVGRLPLGSWNRVFVALILADALFMALTALLIVAIGEELGLPPPTTLLAVFLHHTNYVTVSAYMIGLTDPAEAMAIALTVWLCLTGRVVWLVPVIALAPLAKETTLVFTALIAITAVLAGRGRRPRSGLTVAAAIALGVVVLEAARGVIGGPAFELHRLSAAGIAAISPATVSQVFLARSVMYSLLPLAVLILIGGWRNQPAMPPSIKAAIGVAVAAAVGLAIYSRIGENVARPLWAIVGWWAALCAAAAVMRSPAPQVAVETETSRRLGT